MTFQEWLSDLLDPAKIAIEGIYNLTFEFVATVIFVRFFLKGIIKRELKKHGVDVKED